MIKLKDDAWDLVQNHPVYNQSYQVKEANAEFQELYNKYIEMPPYQKRREEEWLVSIGLGKIEEVEQYGGEGQGKKLGILLNILLTTMFTFKLMGSILLTTVLIFMKVMVKKLSQKKEWLQFMYQKSRVII